MQALWLQAGAAGIALALTLPADATTHRSASAKAAFKRAIHCPATGQPRGACPGWIVDHIVPLCAGGADHPTNMQWQTVADARRKDNDERIECRRRASALTSTIAPEKPFR